jgi:adhesin transport system outer membrane protein
LALRVCLSALLVCIGVATSPALADTLADALARAVVNLPEVRAARANQRAIEQNTAQARGAWYPTVDTSLGQGRESSNNPSTRALGSDQTLTRREAEVNLSQLIFDGGAASGQVRRFQARAEGAGDQVANAAESAGLRVAQAYLDVIRLRELIAIALDNEKRHRETLSQVSRLADVGQGRRADAHQAEARYALAQASLTQLRGQLAQAQAAFAHLTGQAPGALADAGSFQAQLPATLDAALSLALDAHPAIRAAQKDLLAAQADRESQRSRFESPRLALEVGSSANHDLDGIRGTNADRYAMLRLRYNLFRGGIDASRTSEAAARVDEALANLGKARNDTERDLRQAWQGLGEDRNRLPQLERYAAASAQVVASYRLQFSIGQRTLLDVLNAENELFSAKSSHYTGVHTVTIGELRVLSTMGKLLETLGVDLNSAPQTQKQERQTAAAELHGIAETVATQAIEDKDASAQTDSGKIAAMQTHASATDRESDGGALALSLRMSTSLGSAAAAR